MLLVRPVIVSLCLVALAFTLLPVYRAEQQRRAIKEDLIELSAIKYGLFSVEEWKQILSTILAKKLNELNLSSGQRAELRDKISRFLTTTIEDFESRYYEEKSKSVKGLLEGAVASITGMFGKMKKDIPIFTEQILDFLSDADNRDKVKSFLLEKLNEYTDNTFGKIDYSEVNAIVAKYGQADREHTIRHLQAQLDQIREQQKVHIASVFFVFGLLCVIILFGRRFSAFEFILYVLCCLILLAAGLILPMIEIDARIEEMSFALLGEPVSFFDQVLYYRSKSILEVVRLLLHQSEWKVCIVGFLVLTFSVLFPVCKMLASIVYALRPSLDKNRLVRFLVFRTGKWSMADVLVVAIFMAYIGFSGILTEQLAQLDNLSRRLEIVTTNQSSLQVGFFLFTAFALLSLLLSHRLQYKKAGSSGEKW